RIELAMDKIKGYFGQNIEKAMPLAGDVGHQEPINYDLVEERLNEEVWADQVLVTGGVNVLWAKPSESLTPTVAINVHAVENFMQNLWPPGLVRPLAEPIDFLAGPGGVVGGKMTRLSPEEPQQALVLKIAERIEAGADAEEMKRWKACLLSATGRVVRAETWDDQYFWVTNARRRFRDAAAAI
ncbi:unnamed protein product, partial [Prorocentrum cordatum]